jgi:hypothetical protein
MDEKELPEWYHMAKSFFHEISCYSSSMYEGLNGNAILYQIRYAAEREAAQHLLHPTGTIAPDTIVADETRASG